MFSLPKAVVTFALLLGTGIGLAQSSKFPGIGRPATDKEVAAWDIDVRPDFKGLPAGAGSVMKGQDVWESKCAHCHGVFGESNEVFSPIIGGTTAQDIQTGRAANLSRTDYPGRTTIMKVATLSTMWDYINRAMPWTNPKSLSTEEVYAVTAFLLNMAYVVPDDFVLSDKNMAEVQARLPNRNGMTTQHAMWPGKEFGGKVAPDTRNSLCMTECTAEPQLASFLPEFARNAHGNLAEQNRIVGAQRGANTQQPELATGNKPVLAPVSAPNSVTAPSRTSKASVVPLLNKYSCTACHGMDKKVVGPGFNEIAKKYPGKVDYLIEKIKQGGSGVWGAIPMPPQSLPDADARVIAEWISQGASK